MNVRAVAGVPPQTSPTDVYAHVAPWLEKVEQALIEQLDGDDPALVEIFRYGCLLGGKRLRPALALLSGSACGAVTQAHVTVATVLEMVHTATLVHDDVLDAATLRRHVPTVNAQWDSATSILLGDWLFSKAYALAATLGSTDACRMIGVAATDVCQGEMRQLLSAGDLELDEATYFRCIRGKTAALCRVSCELGAHLAAAPVTWSEALGRYGEHLGVAFQIVDDYLDIWGAPEHVGKSLGSDIGQAKLTLPLIRLRDQLPASGRDELNRILQGPSKDRIRRLEPLLLDSDAQLYTRDVATRTIRQAISELLPLPESEAKQTLERIAEFCVQRQH